MAEAGDLSALETTLKANPDVLSVVDSGAVLPPGKSVTLTVDAHGRFNHVSVTAMLIPTNDGFFGNIIACEVFFAHWLSMISPAKV
jgi:hypothetical protein